MSEYSFGSFGEKPSFMQTLATVLSILFPIGLLVASFVFLYLTQGSFTVDLGSNDDKSSGIVIPSQVLDDKYKFKDKELTIKGEVGLESVTCNKLNCPKEDSCCGCPETRNLIIFDSGGKILRESGGVLRLMNEKNEPYCQRDYNSCDYLCPGWEIGAIYAIDGIFYADPPPKGTALSLFFDYYFVVEGQRQVEGTSFAERGKRILEAIKDLIGDSFGSGSTIILQD